MIEAIEPIALAAVALVAAYVIFGVLPKRWLGPDVSILNPLRRAILPALDRVFSEAGGYAETTVRDAEYVGTYDGTLADLEQALYDAGYRRYPLASLASTPDGRTELASWAKHDSVFDERQTHVRLYDSRADLGETGQAAFDVYAHAEYTAHNPLYAAKHYNGVGLSPDEGVARATQHLRGEDIDLILETGDGDPFEPPFRAPDTDLMDHVDRGAS